MLECLESRDCPSVVTGLTPDSGPTAGGPSTVEILGSGFTGASLVSFGGATVGYYNFTVVNDGQIDLSTLPAHAAGTVDVTVTTPDGTSAATDADKFKYEAPPAPAVSAVTPASGSTAGGAASIQILGSGFTGATSVSFGGASVSYYNFTVVNDGQIGLSTLPAHAAGIVDVTVTTPNGTSAVTDADQFRFAAQPPPPPPAVTGVTPNSGPAAGGYDTVDILGSGFTGATSVSFGGASVSYYNFTVVNDGQIDLSTLPAHAAGIVDVTVTTPNGTSAVTDADKFRFAAPPPPAVTGVTPDSGPAAGGYDTVDILGSGFSNASSVSFGGAGVSYYYFTVVSENEIDVSWLPAQAAGMVDVTVTTPNGTSAVTDADQFTYVGVPTTTSLSSSADPSTFGQALTLTATVSNGGLGTPTGTVEFDDGATVLGTATLSAAGQATFPTASLDLGDHPITAAYSGDSDDAGSQGELDVTVVDVPPTATVANSGGVEGSPVTFTVSDLQDPNPSDTVTYLADWDGSGQFQELTPDQLTTNPDGSVSFTHVYDDAGSYNAVIALADVNGGTTDLPTTAAVALAPPTDDFGPQGGGADVTLSTPFVFTDVSAPSPAEAAAGFTYYVSIDGGPVTSSSSPSSLLPAGLPSGVNTVAGYVSDAEGQVSATVTDSFTLLPPQVVVQNGGTGTVLLSWDGNPSGVTVGPDQQLVVNGAADNFTATLETPGATYALATNAGFAQVNAAAGVTGVTLSVSTELDGAASVNGSAPPYTVTAIDGTAGPAVGSGGVGEIDLPAGSTLSVQARGDLGSIIGPDTDGTLAGTPDGVEATTLSFADLTGSISGVDGVAALNASGWLGTGAAEQVSVWQGIQSLTAYGVGATVQADADQNAADPALTLNVGTGGVTGTFTAEAVAAAQISGGVNALTVAQLAGSFTALGAINLLEIAGTAPAALPILNIPNQANSIIASGTYAAIRAGDVGKITANQALTVVADFTATHIGSLTAAGDLNVGSLTTTVKGIDALTVAGNLTVQQANGTPGNIIGQTGIGAVSVAGKVTAGAIQANTGNVGPITVGSGAANPFAPAPPDVGLYAQVRAVLGNVANITVTGVFTTNSAVGGPVPGLLVDADNGSVGNITVSGRLGGGLIPGAQTVGALGTVRGQSIGQIRVTPSTLVSPAGNGNIGLVAIVATQGGISGVTATPGTGKGGLIMSRITATGGDIGDITASMVAGAIDARATLSPAGLPQGGSIGLVIANTLLSPLIHADYYIEGIRAKSGDPLQGGNVTTAVQAQCGGDAGQPSALDIEVSNAVFAGTVTFGYRGAIDGPFSAASVAIDYDGNQGLLHVEDSSGGVQRVQDWTVASGASYSAYLYKAVFAPVGGALKLMTEPAPEFTLGGAELEAPGDWWIRVGPPT